MSLIKTLEEIGEVLPKLVAANSDFSQQPNFNRTEYKYIVPVIGSTLYSSLQTAYDANTLDADEQVLVKHIRLVTAAYAHYDQVGLQLLTFNDAGISKILQGGTDRIFGWELRELKDTLIITANDGMEVLLNYLFDNKALFPEWTASTQYKKIKSLLIRTGTELNDNYTVFQPQRSFYIMRSIMFDLQRMAIQEDIGLDLLVYLRDKVSPTEKETECLDLLKKALTFFTIAKACKSFSVSFADGTFTILGEKTTNNETQDQNNVDIKLLETKTRESENDADAWLELAKNTLVAVYTHASVTEPYKTAFDTGPLKDYVQPEERTSGNERRKSYMMP